MAQITVTSNLDADLVDLAGNGTCDLREAIEAANTNAAVGECPAGTPGLDTIEFDVPNIGSGSIFINPVDDLPTLNDGGSDPIILDGASQPGASCPSSPVIALVGNGGTAGLEEAGLILGSGNTVRGFNIQNFLIEFPFDDAKGIIVRGSNNHIACNLIGTNLSGETEEPNAIGIHIDFGSNNIIGSNDDGIGDDEERNLISGQDGFFGSPGIGVWDEGTSNTIAGNYFGTDATGRGSIPNVKGIQIGAPLGAAPKTLGSTEGLLKDNIIANSSDIGIDVLDGGFDFEGGSENNCIVGNEDGAAMVSPSVTVLENNWWGATDGPGGDGPGLGDTINPGIDADPFLSTPAKVCAFDFRKTFTDDPAAPGGTVTLEFTINNPDPGGNFTGIGFTDDLGSLITGLTALGLPESDVCGAGSSLTVSGAGVLELTGGRLGPGGSCTFSVTLQVPADAESGTYFNMTSDLTGTIGGEGVTLDPAGDALVISALLLTKEFTDDPVFPGDMVTLEFTVTNASGEDLEAINFIDNVEAMLAGLVPTIGQLPLTDVCGDGSTFDFAAVAAQSKNLDGQTISPLGLSEGVLNDGESCTFSLTLDVPPGAAPGIYVNTTTEVEGTPIGERANAKNQEVITGAPATDELNILGEPELKKEFTDEPAAPGGTVTLKFTITNPDPQNGVQDIAFTDDLDDMLAGTLATSFETTEGGDVIPITDLCGTGSSLDFTEEGVLVFTGGRLAPLAMCMFTVTLEVPAGTSPGDYSNVITDFAAVVGQNPGAVFTSEEGVDDDLTVAAVPLFTKEFLGDPILPGDDITLRFRITNTNSTEEATAVGFTDDLDILDIDGDPNTNVTTTLGLGSGETLPKTVCTTGDLSFADGVLTLTGGTVPAGGFCEFDVILNAPETISVSVITGDDSTQDLAPGTYLNTTSTLTSTIDGTTFETPPATDDFLVAGEPTFVKSFADAAAEAGGTVVLSFTIINPDPNSSLTDITFTDDLEAVLAGLTPTDLPKTDVCGEGSGLGLNGDGDLMLIDGTLDPGSSCIFDVTLQIPAEAANGAYPNTTSSLTAMLHGSSVTVDPATDDLNVGVLLLFTKTFLDDTVTPGASVTLAFTITNLDPDNAATSISFTDDLGAIFPDLGLLGLSESDVCGDGSTWGEATSAEPALAFASLAKAGDPGDSCTFDVTFTVPGSTVPGVYVNTTTSLSASLGGPLLTFPPATDELNVVDPLTLLKAFTDDPVLPGGTVTLEFTIANAGDKDLTGLTFEDDLTAVLAGLLPSETLPKPVCNGGALSEAAGVLTLTDGALDAGDSCTFSVVLDVPIGARAGTYANVTSEIEGETGAGRISGKVLETITGAPAIDDLEVSAIPVIQKEFTDDPVSPGETVTLAFTITNPSTTDAATEIAFMDDLDAVLAGLEVTSFDEEEGGGFTPIADVCGAGSEWTLTAPAKLTLTGGSLAVDSECTFSVTVAVPESAASGAYVNMTTDLTAVVDEEAVLGNVAEDDLIVSAAPRIEKSFTDDPVAPGTAVTLDFTLTNTDPDAPISDLEFTDDLDAVVAGLEMASVISNDCGGTVSGTSTISFSEGTLAGDASCTISVSLAVPASAEPGSYLNTTSTITGDIGGDVLEGNPATDNLDVVAVPMLSKSFIDDPVLPGGTVTLEFTITYGEATANATDIAFTDDLDEVLSGLVATGLPVDNICGDGSRIDGTDELSFTRGTLEPETSCTFSVTLDVPAGAAPGSYPNETSDLTADVDGLPVTGEPATDDLVIPALVLTKEFTDDPVTPGGTVTLKFTLTNTGTEEATSITFMDNLEAMLAGLDVDTSLPIADACGGGSSFGLSAGKNRSASSISPLELTGGNLDPGETCMFSVVLSIPGFADPGEYPNTTTEVEATVDSETVTALPATDILVISAPLTLLKEFTDDPVVPGGTVTLEFNLTYEAEDGEPDATSITFDDDLEAVLSGLAPAAGEVPQTVCNGGTLSEDSSVLTLEDGTLSPGETCTFSVVLDVPAFAAPGSYANVTSEVTAEVGGERASSKTLSTITGDPAMDDLEVGAIPVLTKAFTDDPVAPGGTVTLEFTITNPNPTEEATDIAFTDDLDAALSGLVAVGLPADDICGAGSSLTGAGLLEFTGGRLPPGGSCTFSVTLQVPAGADLGVYTNETGLLSAEIDGTSVVGNMAEDDLNVEGLPLLSKEFTDDPAAPGGTATLAFTIINTDPDNAASDIAFTDDLDAVISGMELASVISNDCGGTVTGTDTIMFSGGSLDPGASCTITVSVSIPGDASEGSYTNTTSGITAEVGGETAEGASASDELEVVAVPVLDKSFTDDPVMPGDPVTLEFTISHEEGTLAAIDLTFTDALDAILTGLAMTGVISNDCGGTVTGTGTISFSGGSLDPGETCTILVTLSVPGTAAPGSVVTNTTSPLTAAVGGVSVTSDPATDDLIIAGLLTLTKEFTDDPVAPGGTVTLDFTLTNNDPDNDATDIAFTDNLDAVISGMELASVISNDCGGTVSGTGTITFTGGTLGAGESCTISVSLSVPASAVPTDYTNTTSDATATIDSETVTAPGASDVLSVTEALIITKEFTDDPVGPGGTVALKFTITFEGESEATDITFTDDLDAVLGGLEAVGLPASDVCGDGSTLSGTDVLTLTGGNLEPGTMCMFTVTLQVPETAADGTYPNTTSDVEAQVDGETVTGAPATDNLDVVTDAELEVTKVDELVVPDGSAEPGDAIKYTVEIANVGERPATEVVFSDTVDDLTDLDCGSVTPTPTSCTDGFGGSLTIEVGTIGKDETVTIMFTVTIDSPIPAGTEEVSNQGLVTGNNFDDIETDDPDDTTSDADPTVTSIDADPDVVVAKLEAEIINMVGGPGADPGDKIKYTVTITNIGDEDAAGAIFTDTPGENTTLVAGSVMTSEGTVTMGNGTDPDDTAITVEVGTINGAGGDVDEVTIMFEVMIDSPYPADAPTVENQGLVTGDNFADTLTDDPNTEDENAPTVTEVTRQSDFSLTKTASSATPDYLDTVEFTLTVTNNGPVPSAAKITDVLPAGLTLVDVDPEEDYDEGTSTWTTDVFAVGETREFTITALVETIEPVTNEASVASIGFPDPDEDNNSDDSGVVTPVAADLAITKTLLSFSGDPETNIIRAEFRLLVTNKGPRDATGVIVDDELPEGATLESIPDDYDPDAGIWTIGDLAVGESATLILVMLADAQFNLLNIAIVSGNEPDQEGNNNLSAAQAQHDNQTVPSATLAADLSLRMTVDNELPEIGDTISYAIELTNDGPSPTAGVAVRALLAESQEFVDATVSPKALCKGCGYDDSLGVWTVGQILKEATKTLTIRVVVGSTGEIGNTAEVIKSYLPDPDSQPDNGEAEDDDQDSIVISVSQPVQTRDLQAQASLLEIAEVPTEFELGSNYPNPFNPETTIPFAVPEKAHVELAVYDLLGREVALLLDEERSAGRYEMKWQADNLPTGVYIVRMRAAGLIKTQRVVLVK